MKQYRKQRMGCVIAALVLLSGCNSGQQGAEPVQTESEPAVATGETVLLDKASQKYAFDLDERWVEETYAYDSPDASYRLVVCEAEEMGSAFRKRDVGYAFCWEEEDGLTEPAAYAPENGAFQQLGEWTTTRKGLPKFTDGKSFAIVWGETGVQVSFGTPEAGFQQREISYPDRTKRRQETSLELSGTKGPAISAVTDVTVSADCFGEISRKVELSNWYGMNYMTTNCIGAVGAPVDILYMDSLEQIRMTFHYDPALLAGIPEENLVVLYYAEAPNRYFVVADAELDMEANTVTAPVRWEGEYLLINPYWWCPDMTDLGGVYAIPKASDWETWEDTGDILTLADKGWAKANAPSFTVSTVAELASAVYYINALAEEETVTISLEADLDLSEYAWAPMGWRRDGCSGLVLNGNGHTISGLTISQPEQREVGLVGYAEHLEVSDLRLTDANVTGENYVGLLCGVCYDEESKAESVSAEGTVTASGEKYGALFGDEWNSEMTDCTAEVTVNGTPSPYLSARQRKEAEGSESP